GSTRTISLERTHPQTRKRETETIRVRIPPGVADRQSIRVSGKGEAGQAGGSPGDLYLRVRVAAHPDFQVRGADLYYDVDVTPWEAVLGASVTISSLRGKLNLRIPPGSSGGQQLRMRGQGLPKGKAGETGDLYAVINVQVPQELNEEERGLWEKLGEVSRFKPRG
ncbi:MAG TPA: J domain-containing protein, partial [Chthoniobacteraceae bacterium]|nr:J domain-containing protein [Chthoniobacteraceae bacterium]